jgi:hypothetical protein
VKDSSEVWEYIPNILRCIEIYENQEIVVHSIRLQELWSSSHGGERAEEGSEGCVCYPRRLSIY